MLGFYEEFEQLNKKQKDDNIKMLDKALFEFEIVSILDSFIPTVSVGQGFFYQMTVNDESIVVDKKDFRLQVVDKIEISTSVLTDSEKEVAISLAYSFLSNRLEPNKNSQCIKYVEKRKGKEDNNSVGNKVKKRVLSKFSA